MTDNGVKWIINAQLRLYRMIYKEIKTMKKLSILFFLLWSANASAVDHTMCARFYNDARVHRADYFVPGRIRAIPVEITNSGTISVLDDQHIVDNSTSADGLVTTVVYRSPFVRVLEDYTRTVRPESSGEATLTIVRNESDGSIVEIIEELPNDFSGSDREYYSTVIGIRTMFEVKTISAYP